MKNECNETLEAKIAEDSERAKKLYRYVSDVARRIGEATVASKSISDLFSINLEVQRQKLRDNCEKLLFLDPLNHGKKSLELLWRKVYYETVSAAKKLRESESDSDNDLFTHIVCGIGHFHHFITRIQSKMNVQYKEIDYMSYSNDEESDELNGEISDDEVQFGKSILHSCLIYLGDLSRYQVEIFHTFDPSISARYYLQAAHVDLSSGMPYNQLGNLYMDKNYNLDSVSYYIHCLNCTTPFDGAMGNLTKIFEKNNQLCDIMHDPDTKTQSEHVQNTVANFLSLIEIWYFNKDDTDIPQRCNTIAQQLKIAMDFTMAPLPDIEKNYIEYTQALEEETNNPSYLNGNLIHKIVLICLFSVVKMSETDEQKAFACKAFTLALLSQLLHKLLKQLTSFGFQNPALNYKPRITLKVQEKYEEKIEIEASKPAVDTIIINGSNVDNPEVTDTVSGDEKTTDDLKKLANGDAKNYTKKSLTKRRRRRRVASSESSDMSDADTESSEVNTDEASDDEDFSDSIYQSDEDSKSEVSNDNGSDIEQVDEGKVNGKVTEETQTKTDQEHVNNPPLKVTELKENELNETEIQNFLLGDNFLSSIKLLQEWVLNEKDLILSCGESGESLFQCVVDLLNIFTYYFNSKNNEIISKYKILEYSRTLVKKLKLEFKTIPLPEDLNLRGTNICKFDKDAAEWQIFNRYKPSVYEENIIRILDFIDFGNQIAKIVPRIRFNRSMKVFYLKSILKPTHNTKINHKRSREWHNSKKHPEVRRASDGASGRLPAVCRRMGRLYLAAQVRELERRERAPPAALLALDAASLHKHMRRVRQLARDFLLLIPAVVVQELDNLKRDSKTAREAIRWLEVQLKSSRFLRAQRAGQSKPLPLLKCPRKAPPHVHNFIQILEFCSYIISDEKQSQGGNGDPDSSLHGKSAPLLILLVGNEPGKEEEQYKDFSLIGTAQAAGISVEYIEDFYTKHRKTMHKSGKKR